MLTIVDILEIIIENLYGIGQGTMRYRVSLTRDAASEGKCYYLCQGTKSGCTYSFAKYQGSLRGLVIGPSALIL